MIGLRLSAIDTLHLRDAAAHGRIATSPEHHSGGFPPQPATVVGAIRAMLARAQGWEGGPWMPQLTRVLGDGHGPDSLGLLSFDGPYLLKDEEPIFPVPAHLVGTALSETRHDAAGGVAWQPTALLRPGREVRCDLGPRVRLPELDRSSDAQVKPATNVWLTRSGLLAVLRGELPAAPELVKAEKLWTDDPRVGIERDDSSRTVKEEALYVSRHARPAANVSIGVRVAGLPEDWRHSGTAQLGGEGRWAEVSSWSGDARVSAVVDGRRATLVALTPIDCGHRLPTPGTRFDELGATVVSACLPRAERVGGWGSDGRGQGPLPLRSLLPAGSVLFCEIDDPARLADRDEPPRIGERTRWGFGAVALGTWNTEE